jgi:predicted Rossmann-fold nucleotide-binding protein
MFLKADAIIALPGGFGTLDESLEVLYWGHLKMHAKPLVLVNIENYWTPLIDYVRSLPDFDARYLIVVDKVEAIFPALDAWSFPEESLEIKDGFPHFEGDILRPTSDPIILHEASIQNSYHFITALGLKQLDKHQRPMGILNDKGQFDSFIEWLHSAADEHFITEKCLELYAVAKDKDTMDAALKNQKPVHIDLHREKWGDRRTRRGKVEE